MMIKHRTMAVPHGRYRSRRLEALRGAAWAVAGPVVLGVLIALAWVGVAALLNV